ncbi:hypothetical protein TNCV_5001251 [Trichonephila clavipes]|nr:hypothetical protein TNCV_5001251 [Trichonephila clavipes]
MNPSIDLQDPFPNQIREYHNDIELSSRKTHPAVTREHCNRRPCDFLHNSNPLISPGSNQQSDKRISLHLNMILNGCSIHHSYNLTLGANEIQNIVVTTKE